jgi:hypothetical protein
MGSFVVSRKLLWHVLRSGTVGTCDRHADFSSDANLLTHQLREAWRGFWWLKRASQ